MPPDVHALSAYAYQKAFSLLLANLIRTWLFALHMAHVFGLPFRIFVCVLGLVITTLSATGVYIWWKKRSARLYRETSPRLRRCAVRAEGGRVIAGALGLLSSKGT